jgi:HEAT repeat protein
LVDPVSVILAALAAAANAETKDTTSQAAKDAYTGLKALLKKRFEKKPQAEMALAEYEKDTDTWEKPLQKSLVETGADQDEAIVRQAQQVLKLVNRQQASQGKSIVNGDQAHIEFHLFPESEPHVDLTAAEAIYRQKVVDAYKWLNFSGFARPDLSLANVPLEDVFVPLTLTVEKVIQVPEPSEQASQAERGERRQRERVVTVQEPIELGQALSNHLLIVGEPGAGKSTLLRWLAVTFAQGRQREPNQLGSSADADRLPVLVELGRLPDRYLKSEGGQTPNWIQFLPEYLTAQIAFATTPPQLLTRALADGRCLLLFDGLDEVTDRRTRARLARSLVELTRLSPGNRMIIGSRPAGVSESEGALRPQFQRCQIARFTPEDVRRFFRFWYALDHGLTPEQQYDAADALYARVQAAPATLELASTPLLSTILALIWRNEGNLPERRVELYELYCRFLIELWEASHDVAYQGTLVGMNWEDHLHLLTPLAYTIHSQEQRTTATREELVPLLAKALQTTGYSIELAAATREAQQFLDALGLRSGLLQYMGNNRYGFQQRTFQEYLVARYIAAQPDLDYIDLVMAHLHEAWWLEVHLLTIAHLGSGNVGARKASALILTILRVYAPPHWILRSSRNRWLRLIMPGKLLPQVQLERRIAWILAREFGLATKGSGECMLDETTMVGTILSAQTASLMRHIIYDRDRPIEQKALLSVNPRLLQRKDYEELVRALHNVDWEVRERAAAVIGQVGMGNEVVMMGLLEAVHHDADLEVQRRAAVLLGQVGVGNEVVVTALLQVLHNADREVRRRAATSLGQVGVGNEVVLNALLEALHRDADLEVRRRAATSLGQVGAGNKVVVNTLLQALHDADREVQRRAAEILGQVGAGNKVVVNALLQALHDADREVQRRAAEILGQVGTGNEVVVNALLQALHDADREVQRRAAEILGQVGVGNEVVVNALLQALHDADWDVRKRAATSLGQVGVGNEVVLNALLQALHDADREVQRRATTSLGQVGVGNEMVVNALLQALHRNADREVRRRAATSLGQVGVGNEVVLNALLQALHHDADLEVRERVATSLGQVGVGNEVVLNALLQALHDADWDVRKRAATSLGQVGVGNEVVVNALLQALHDADREVQRRAAEILGQVGAGNKVVVSALLEVLHDAEVRQQAAESLGRLEIKDTTQLRQVLVALNRCLYDDLVRRTALVSIRQLLDGRPIPGYRWAPLQKRRAKKRRLKRIAFWLGMTAVIALIVLTATWLLGALDPNGFPIRFLAVLVGIVAFIAAVAQILGQKLREPWEQS